MKHAWSQVLIAVTALVAQGLCAAQEGGRTITLVNYAALPVHATAITLDAKRLVGPVLVRRADNGAPVPLTHSAAGVSLYVSLPPTSRIDLVAERTDKWAESNVVEAKGDELENGVLRFSIGKKGWRLAFAQEKATLIEDGALDFRIDTQNRGRISIGETVYVKQLGLARFADSPLEKRSASIHANGYPAITQVHRMGAMKVAETYELVSGMPLLICRVQWKNEGDKPLWVAYVGSGNGVYGRWSKQLMPGPLIERKKTPAQGDINGSETRCAWVGGLCRISMESPATGCGVGLSTLLPTPGKVGQGSMIWGCGASGFQCNFIDPVQGQFPFLVKPGEALDNGFVFLASQTGASVFREAAELWKARQAGKLPMLAPPCAVFVDGEPFFAQTVGGVESRTDAKLALRLDFNKRFECRVSGACKLVARPLVPGKKPVVLLETAQPGPHTLDLNERLGWTDEVAFVLEKEGPSTVSVVEMLPVSPAMLSPVADAQMKDLAAMFRWAAIPMVTEYQVQWARAPNFASPADVRVTSSQDYPWCLVPDDQLPAPERWYWRIRGIKGDVQGAWSETRAFTVDSDHAKRPLKRPLTAERHSSRSKRPRCSASRISSWTCRRTALGILSEHGALLLYARAAAGKRADLSWHQEFARLAVAGCCASQKDVRCRLSDLVRWRCNGGAGREHGHGSEQPPEHGCGPDVFGASRRRVHQAPFGIDRPSRLSGRQTGGTGEVAMASVELRISGA